MAEISKQAEEKAVEAKVTTADTQVQKEPDRLCMNAIADAWSEKYHMSPETYKRNFKRSVGDPDLTDAQANVLWLNKMDSIYASKPGTSKSVETIKKENNCK